VWHLRRGKHSGRSGTASRRPPSVARPFHLSERHNSSSHHHMLRHLPLPHNLNLPDPRQLAAGRASAARRGLHPPRALVLEAAATVTLPRQPPRAESPHLPHPLLRQHSRTPRSRCYRARRRREHVRSFLRATASCSTSWVVHHQLRLPGRLDAQRRMRPRVQEKRKR